MKILSEEKLIAALNKHQHGSGIYVTLSEWFHEELNDALEAQAKATADEIKEGQKGLFSSYESLQTLDRLPRIACFKKDLDAFWNKRSR